MPSFAFSLSSPSNWMENILPFPQRKSDSNVIIAEVLFLYFSGDTFPSFNSFTNLFMLRLGAFPLHVYFSERETLERLKKQEIKYWKLFNSQIRRYIYYR